MTDRPTSAQIPGADESRELAVLEEFLSERDDSIAEQYSLIGRIVDLYHAKGHLWGVAQALYGAGTDLAE